MNMKKCEYTGEDCVADRCGEGCSVWEYQHSDLSDREKCLKWICEADAEIYAFNLYVYPCTWCSNITGIPVKTDRKIMKQLETEGYVKKDSTGGYDEWADRIFCIHGYSVTMKGRNTEYWKSQNKREHERINQSLRKGWESESD